MRRVRRLLLAGLCAPVGLGILSLRAGADVVHMKDGSQFEGDIRKTEDGWVLTEADGKPRPIPADRVAYIEARPKAAVDSGEQRLTSLRHAVENITDIKQILARYKAFIDQNPGSPMLDKAKDDVRAWQDRLDRGLVKFGDQWITPAEKAALIARSDAAAGQAMQLLKQARLHEAGPLLDQILADNPQNAAAWYLKGVLLYRQDQLTAARKAFESVIALLPDHAPSLNNIAVIYWRQSQPAIAVNFYDRALAAATNRHDILDNAAEALDALPEEYRNAAVTKKLVRHFNEQDALVQVAMQKQGLYRWGATWVTASDLDKLKVVDKQIKDQLNKLAGDFDAVTARIARIDADSESDRKLARRMELDSYGRDPATGASVRYPLPAGYYDVLHEIKSLQAERVERLAEQDRMRQQAKSIQQSLPMPKFTGLQRIIDTEGAPISAAVLAAALAPLELPTPVPQPPPGEAATTPTTQAATTQPGVPAVAAPAVPQTKPSTGAVPDPLPRHTVVPPEKPSILDR